MKSTLIGLMSFCSLVLAAGAVYRSHARAQERAPAGSLAVRGARIVTVSGDVIDPGTLLIRDGVIAAVGKDVPVPPGIRVVDAAGKTVLPGFIDGFTTLGTGEIPSFGSEEDEAADPVVPHLRVLDAINPDNRFIAIARKEGVTAALSAPGEGNLVSGQSALIRLVEGNLDRMLVKFPAGMHVSIGEAPKLRYAPKGKAPGTRMGEVALLRQTLIDAQQYLEKRTQPAPAGSPAAAPFDPRLEALLPVIRGELPLIVSADKREDILAGIRVADEFRLKMILSHGTEAYRVAAELAARSIPVLLGPPSRAGRRLESMNWLADCPLRLHQAGVRFAFQSGAHGNAAELLAHARAAVSAGLPEDAALRALSIDAARIFGVAERLGSLDPGKAGDALIFAGNPLRELAPLQAVVIGGIESR